MFDTGRLEPQSGALPWARSLTTVKVFHQGGHRPVVALHLYEQPLLLRASDSCDVLNSDSAT